MPRLALAALIALAGTAVLRPEAARAQSPECRNITDSLVRLRCYDDTAKVDVAKPALPSKTLPAFSSYPADAYRGRLSLPDFGSRDRSWVSLRTRIRDGIKGGPNFAGHLAMIEIGCGAGCRTVPVADVRTGQVYSFPLGGEDNMYLNLKYRPDSRLVVAYWEGDGRCIRETLTWNERGFDRLDRADIGADEICRKID